MLKKKKKEKLIGTLLRGFLALGPCQRRHRRYYQRCFRVRACPQLPTSWMGGEQPLLIACARSPPLAPRDTGLQGHFDCYIRTEVSIESYVHACCTLKCHSLENSAIMSWKSHLTEVSWCYVCPACIEKIGWKVWVAAPFRRGAKKTGTVQGWRYRSCTSRCAISQTMSLETWCYSHPTRSSLGQLCAGGRRRVSAGRSVSKAASHS